MAVKTRRIIPAVLVLLVLFTSQAVYAADVQDRSNGHCAGEAPPEQSCPLPLWLTCCDDRAAVGTALNAPAPAGLLALRLESAPVAVMLAVWSPAAKQAAIPPDTLLSRSVILLV